MSQHILATEWLTTRDVSLLPRLGLAESRSDIEMSPFIYSAPMDTVTGYRLTEDMLQEGEFPVVSRFLTTEQIKAMQDFGDNENCFFALGFKDLDLFKSYGMPNAAIDVAHGDMAIAHKFTTRLVTLGCKKIMSGSICTADAAFRAVLAGATHLRVGVGPGAACTTRLKTGVGAPNLSAVYRIHRALCENDIRDSVKIIADGGIKQPGDAAKYLAAGADGVMMGSALSKVRESAGWNLHPEDEDINSEQIRLVKSYRGQASAEFQKDIFGKANRCTEGASSPPFEWDGTTLEEVLEEYRGGVSSSCSYIGAKSIPDMQKVAQFIKVTQAGWHEGTPHGV